MSYNGSGTFVINTSGQPVVAGTVISSTAFNALTADLATGLSTAITKDGQTTTTARIPFAAGINSSLTTDSSSTSTGSIITAGGVGIAKALYVGTTANVAGAATLGSTLTYGGVTLTNAVTGTGKMVLDTSPTLVTPVLGAASATSVTVAAGAVGTPSITTTGDTNTGIFFPAADTIAFAEGGAEIARFDSSGNLLVGVTSANANGGVLQLKSGITFPATQVSVADANTLDDYEEGTWTPVITGTSVAGSATYSTQSGTYVKIGKYVFLQMFVTFTSAHTGTGGTKVGGFPFTIGADFGGGGTITYKTAWVTNGPDFMQTEANTTFGYLRYDTNTAQGDIAPNVNIQNTTGFMQSIWYLASA
jgi:hypothetical protein